MGIVVARPGRNATVLLALVAMGGSGGACLGTESGNVVDTVRDAQVDDSPAIDAFPTEIPDSKIDARLPDEVDGGMAPDATVDVSADLDGGKPATACSDGKGCSDGTVCAEWPGTSGSGLCVPKNCSVHSDCPTLPGLTTCCVGSGLSASCKLTIHSTCQVEQSDDGLRCSHSHGCGDDSLCVGGGSDGPRCALRCVDAELCGQGEACIESVFGSACMPADARVGTRDQGEPCTALGENECVTGLACVELGWSWQSLGAVCLRACSTDADCGDGWWCATEPPANEPFSGPALCLPDGPVAAGGSCAHDSLGCSEGSVCMRAGTHSAACEPLCGRCPPGQECRPNYLGSSMPRFPDKTPFRGCASPAAPSLPATCTVEPANGCGSAACWPPLDGNLEPSFCVQLCLADDVCSPGYVCENLICRDSLGLGGVAGDACRHDAECRLGTVCGGGLPDQRDICVPACFRDGIVCPDGSWCDGSGCVPIGLAPLGEECNEDWDCRAGLTCHRSGGASRCRQPCYVDTSCPVGSRCRWSTMPDPASVPVSRACVSTGTVEPGGSCAGSGLTCSADSICIGRGVGQICAKLCGTLGAVCPEGSACYPTLVAGEAVCIPYGTAQSGSDCINSPWACAEGLECVVHVAQSPGDSWSACLRRCGAPFPAECGAGGYCELLGHGRSFCIGLGDTGVGDTCPDGQMDCSGRSVCYDGRCRSPCVLGRGCGDGLECQQRTAADILFCVPPGVSVDGTLAPTF